MPDASARNTDGPTIYWEDIEVGQVLEGGAHTFTTEDIKRFATEFDPRPTHLDEAAAAETFFGGLAASGTHTFAVWAKLYWHNTPGWATEAGAEIRRMRLPRPVRPGDTLTLRTEITGKRLSPINSRAGFIDQSHEMTNQDGRRVCTMDCTIMIERRPKAELEEETT